MKQGRYTKLNKKGFTLVELIVVIAIMAILAGTVAGVTVSQLRRQTDNNNYNSQAVYYVKALSAALASGDTNKPDFYGDTAETAAMFNAAKILNYLNSEMVGAQEVTWDEVNTATPTKGHFSVCVNESGNTIYIVYTGVQIGFGTKYYKLNELGEYSATDTMDLTT